MGVLERLNIPCSGGVLRNIPLTIRYGWPRGGAAQGGLAGDRVTGRGGGVAAGCISSHYCYSIRADDDRTGNGPHGGHRRLRGAAIPHVLPSTHVILGALLPIASLQCLLRMLCMLPVLLPRRTLHAGDYLPQAGMGPALPQLDTVSWGQPLG